MIRPAARAALLRWREVGAALATLGGGLWLVSLGGWLMQGLGLVVAGLGAGWTVIALRRMRFLRAVTAPGLVEVDEGQISYFGAGPALGGQVALRDLAEIRLLHLRGEHFWRLKQADGQAILIPVAAAGAAALYDAFATLPGIDMRRLSAALNQRATAQSLWRRPTHLPLT